MNLLIIDTENFELVYQFFNKYRGEVLLVNLSSYFMEDKLTKFLQKEELAYCRQLQISGKLEEYAESLKDTYTDFIENYPQKVLIKNVALHKKKIGRYYNFWWLNEPSTKRSDAYPTFTRFLQLQIINDYINKHSIKRIYIISYDQSFIKSIKLSFKSCTVIIWTNGAGGKDPSTSTNTELVKVFIKNVIWFINSLKIIYQIKKKKLKREVQKKQNVFYSIYPKLWISKNYKIDEKYSDYFIETEKSCFLISVVNNGFVQNCKTDCLRKALNLEINHEHYFIDHYFKWKQLFLFLQNVIRTIVVTKEILLKNKVAAKIKNINISTFLEYEFLIGALNIPRVIWESQKIEEFFKIAEPYSFNYYLYEWALGRSFLYLLKNNYDTKFIGYQHGPINKARLYNYHHFNKLDFLNFKDNPENMPHPDILNLEDEVAVETLSKSGYPKKMLNNIGSKRTDYLDEIQNLSEKDNIFFAPGLSDGEQLFSLVLLLIRNKTNYKIKFKPHPRATFNLKLIENKYKDIILENDVIWTSDISSGLSWSSIVVGTYSSVLEEALKINKDVIIALSAKKYTESSLLNNKSVCKISNSKELIELLKAKIK